MKDVIIIGGGLKGMLTALFLHDAGLNVMIVDQKELGRESSWAGGGLVSPLYPWRANPVVSALVRDSQLHYPALCTRLALETGVDPQWNQSGLLITDTQEAEQAQSWATENGYALQLLGQPELQYCEPQLNTRFSEAIFLPELGQVRSPRLSAALRASLRLRPILVSEHQPVKQLAIEAERVAGVYIGERFFEAKKVVLTAGAWTGLFPEAQTAGLTLRPMQAESIMFRTERHTALKRVIVHDGLYLIPRQDGRTICGAVMTDSDLDKQPTPEALERLTAVACDLMPSLRPLPVHNHWSSLLSFSTQQAPIIGEHPSIQGLYLNAGHGSDGIATGLGSVRALVGEILGQPLA